MEIIKLSDREADEFHTLGAPGSPAVERYRKLRFKGTSHNMAMILASGEGPAGIVKGSLNPTPKIPRATGDNTLGGGKITGLKRRTP